MATDKVNAPAVSRLAGEIADRIWAELMKCGNLKRGEYADIISAALLEREEKVAKLIEAAKAISSKYSLHKSVDWDIYEDLRAALSALGESKG